MTPEVLFDFLSCPESIQRQQKVCDLLLAVNSRIEEDGPPVWMIAGTKRTTLTVDLVYQSFKIRKTLQDFSYVFQDG